MSARDALTPELRAEVLRLEDDLRARVASLPEVQSAWRAEYDAARAAERTAAAWEVWIDERVTLAAVAWVLTTVFVRFCEDNALVKPVWISGPRRREAIEAQQQFLRETARTNADVTDREWLLQAVEHLKSLPATAGLVDDTSPMRLVEPSGDAATRLLNFWRERDESGALIRDLSDPDLGTRFLGDLYQEISDDAKKRYALLQTPVFVEEFILDRTLEPALNERPLEGFKLIDPTCGSGHFLLGGFQRLLDRWHKHAPGLDERERVQAALDSVYGVDINPFAVAIARFRLTVAALQACGLASLEDAPAFKYHLAAGDSLLHGLDQGEFELGAALSVDRVAADFTYATESLDSLRSILRNDQYDVVVGNPPYITVKDAALNKLYRERYATTHRQYALSVPFMERFFMLARSGDRAGWTGQITSNSFMKREFGSKLIENYLPTKDLRYVIDSEGAWIPGHNMDGTPTVILVGRNARPNLTTVRAVLSKTKRETPANLDGSGPYWRSIVDHLDDPGFDSEWISVTDLGRDSLAAHPWSLAGGGALSVKAAIEDGGDRTIESIIADSGSGALTREDEAYMLGAASLRRFKVPASQCVDLVVGDNMRDWVIADAEKALWPYDADTLEAKADAPVLRTLWPYRSSLRRRVAFGLTQLERGLEWFEYSMFFRRRFTAQFTIAWAGVASHNHFILNREKRVFNRWADVLVLPEGADEDSHLGLLATLNSSTACFWLKQVVQARGGAADIPWSRTYEFTVAALKAFRVPTTLPTDRGRRLDELAIKIADRSPDRVVSGQTPTASALDVAREDCESLRGQMIAQQEELDWEVYRLYGLIDDDMTYGDADLPELSHGERAFEVVLGGEVQSSTEAAAWFERHNSKPIIELPRRWPEGYRELVRKRIDLVKSHPLIGLLERPEHKRRWAQESWDKKLANVLRNWLLGRLEDRRFWLDQGGRPTPKSLAVLADEVARDPELVSVVALWEGRRDVSVASSLEKLFSADVVPYLAALRQKESGLRKRSAWERTWAMQRHEDAGELQSTSARQGGAGAIPIPPTYTGADFLRPEYWSNRGKLDVPKERFISYPNAGREADTTPVVGWAGWDRAQQALALATLIQSGEQQGWPEDRLVPLVAGLAELLPWVEQWHSDPDALYGGSSPAEFFSGLLDTYMAKLGVTRDTLSQWRPPAPTRGRKAKS
jgi:hypothetical protein